MLREAVARGAQLAQRARAQEGRSDTGQGGAAAATRADAEEETGRGSTEGAAWPDAADETGRGGAEETAWPGAADVVGRGGADDTAWPGAVGGETGVDVSECPASQADGEVLAPEPAGAGVECAAAAATTQTTPVVVLEETLVPESTGAGGEGAAAAATAQTVPGNVVLDFLRLIFFFCSELKKVVADETAAKEAVQVAFMSAQEDLKDLEGATVAVCQELEAGGGSSGSSVASRLRSLGGRVAERLRSTFRLGVQWTLAVASTHYDLNLEQVAMGYVVAPGVKGDAVVAAMEQADATIKGFAAALSMKLEGDLLPDVEDNAAEGPHGGEGSL